MIDRFTYLIEKYSFGVCSYIADKIGLRSSRVRLYFIYASFVTFGSPIILYLVVAFWMNIREYIRKSRNFLFDWSSNSSSSLTISNGSHSNLSSNGSRLIAFTPW